MRQGEKPHEMRGRFTFEEAVKEDGDGVGKIIPVIHLPQKKYV